VAEVTRRRYAVVVERASARNWSAYVPDVDGCISTGATAEETLANIREALAFHVEGMAADGDPIPEPAAVVDYIEVEIPAPAAAR
jgi:predicted RNase H-like HicB family nuclease